MRLFTRSESFSLLLAAALALPGIAAAESPKARAPQIAQTVILPNSIVWEPQISYRFASLRVSGPGGFVHNREFGDLKPVFDVAGLADGQYKFELIFGRKPDEALSRAIAATEIGNDGVIANPEVQAKMLQLRETVSGAFRVEGGKTVLSGADEAVVSQKPYIATSDSSIQGSLCVGLDCVATESFGFTTLKLKENNLRILFEDTSNTASFPTTDWQLTANDSANGGLNRFSIEDVTAGRIPFTVEGNAPTNSLYVDSSGRVGFRTNTPVLDLHARTGNTPGLRLEQDGSSGFTAQTWDMAGNEANFFIRDATNGSKLPLRIFPNSPSNSITIGGTSGSVGIGTSAPDSNSRLHVADGVLNLDDDRAVAWGGGSARPAILGNKPGQYFAMYTAGVERLRVDTSVVSFLDGTPLAWGTGSARPAVVGNKASNLLTMHIAGVERLRADSSGVKITGTLHLNGSPLPDYVFSPGFKLASIEENAAYMWKNRHLPAVGPAKTTEDGQGVMDVYSQTRGILEELEKAHIYIEQLNKQIKALRAEAQAREGEFQKEMAELRTLLRK